MTQMTKLALALAAGAAVYGQPVPLLKRPAPRRPAASSAIERFSRMSPQQRDRLFEGMPPERRRQIEERIDQYQRMTPEERQAMEERLRAFESLTPEQQERARRVYRRFADLPADRRRAIQDELRSLESMTTERRRERVASADFESQFPLYERRLMWDMRRLELERDRPRLRPQPGDRDQK